jgi:hypothetical protein
VRLGPGAEGVTRIIPNDPIRERCG